MHGRLQPSLFNAQRQFILLSRKVCFPPYIYTMYRKGYTQFTLLVRNGASGNAWAGPRCQAEPSTLNRPMKKCLSMENHLIMRVQCVSCPTLWSVLARMVCIPPDVAMMSGNTGIPSSACIPPYAAVMSWNIILACTACILP